MTRGVAHCPAEEPNKGEARNAEEEAVGERHTPPPGSWHGLPP